MIDLDTLERLAARTKLPSRPDTLGELAPSKVVIEATTFEALVRAVRAGLNIEDGLRAAGITIHPEDSEALAPFRKDTA